MHGTPFIIARKPHILSHFKDVYICWHRLLKKKFFGTLFNKHLAFLYLLNGLRLPFTTSFFFLRLYEVDSEFLSLRCHVTRHVMTTFVPLLWMGMFVAIIFRYRLYSKVNLHLIRVFKSHLTWVYILTNTGRGSPFFLKFLTFLSENSIISPGK